MPDNVDLTSLEGFAACDEVSYSGQTTAKVQLTRSVGISGAEGSRTVIEPVALGRAATPAITTNAQGTSNVTLKAANSDRRGLIVWNDTAAILYIKFGTTATADDWTWKLEAGEGRDFGAIYTGRVDGIWDATGAGKARVTELQA